MKYSYIKPRKKSIFSSNIILLLSFFSITILMLFSIYFFLLFKDYRFNQNLKDIAAKRTELAENVTRMKKQIAFIENEVLLRERINTENTILKDSIKNLFDLVPKRITLFEASLLKNGLILYGVTPNKDVYNVMLQAPLRSMFHKTYSSFYPTKYGWLSFVSANYIDEGESAFEVKKSAAEVDNED